MLDTVLANYALSRCGGGDMGTRRNRLGMQTMRVSSRRRAGRALMLAENTLLSTTGVLARWLQFDTDVISN